MDKIFGPIATAACVGFIVAGIIAYHYISQNCGA